MKYILMQIAMKLRASYSATYRTCTPFNTDKFLPNSIGILGSDLTLLALMLLGIVRHREAPKFGVVRLLYRQVRWIPVGWFMRAYEIMLQGCHVAICGSSCGSARPCKWYSCVRDRNSVLMLVAFCLGFLHSKSQW